MFQQACDPTETNTAFYVWRYFLLDLLGIETDKDFQSLSSNEDPAKAVFLILRKNVNISEKWREFLPLLNNILPFLKLQETELTRNLDSMRKQLLTCSLLKYLVQQKSKKHPFVLILEDVECVDPSSMKVLLELASDLPFIFLLISVKTNTVRLAEEVQQLRVIANEVISLKMLAESELMTVLCDRLGISPEKQSKSTLETLKGLVKLSNGSPLFAVSMVTSLKEQKRVTVAEGIAKFNTSFQKIERDLPRNVQDVIGSTIDKLDTNLQLLLKVASVIGIEFHKELLFLVHPIEDDKRNLEQLLQKLVNLELIEKVSKQSYKFCSLLIRDVAYGRLLFETKFQLHEMIAKILEKQIEMPANSMEVVDVFLVANHWLQACKNKQDKDDQYTISVIEKLMKAASKISNGQNVRSLLSSCLELVGTLRDDNKEKRKIRSKLQLQYIGISNQN